MELKGAALLRSTRIVTDPDKGRVNANIGALLPYPIGIARQKVQHIDEGHPRFELPMQLSLEVGNLDNIGSYKENEIIQV